MSRPALFGQKAWKRLSSTFGRRRAIAGTDVDGRTRLSPQPGALVLPEETFEVAFALQTAKAEGVPIVVSGTGSRLDGAGLKRLSEGGFLLLETQGLAGVEEVDSESLWMIARAGTRLSEVVSSAAEHGCRPLGFGEDDPGTLGGWLSAHTRIPDGILGIPQPAVIALEAVLPGGAPIRSVQSPRAASGPDLFSLLLGTRGGFGVITAACLKLEPVPERQLMAGFRFRSMERAFAFVRTALEGLIPPRRLQLMVDGQPGRRMALVWMAIEGQASLAAAAMRSLWTEAEQAGGQPRDLARVRAWREASAFDAQKAFEAPVRWSKLPGLLRGADRLMGGFAFAVLDRPCLTGCRVRVAASRGSKGNLRPGWRRLADPDGLQAVALRSARQVMQRVRHEMDPQGLLNPQAFPLPWVGGVR